MTQNELEAAVAAIKIHLVNRLLTEGHLSACEGHRLYESDIYEILEEVFKHCRRVVIPVSDGFLIFEPQDIAA